MKPRTRVDCRVSQFSDSTVLSVKVTRDDDNDEKGKEWKRYFEMWIGRNLNGL